ncbi:unnamed protein product [Taenia asiatica]|uniref:Lipin_N domain-containing protein n=1 Tax=Taenia asiatica TaxID=60517 RepID=A0A0R3W6E5_TAEAS|nr:unnamed protein product [Taenia asiatica]
MQYIERFFSSAKRMYSDINSATLSGAIDVIVVRYPNGELVSSPFYVQFGKTGVFRPCADEVEVVINGVPRTDLHMRVNRFGQAYFDDLIFTPVKVLPTLRRVALLYLWIKQTNRPNPILSLHVTNRIFFNQPRPCFRVPTSGE